MGREANARKSEAPVTESAKFSEAQLEQIHTDTKKLDTRERVAYWDKRQSRQENGIYPATVALCPNDASHGALTIHGSGSLLMCGVRKGGAWCTGTMPVSQG